MNNLLVSRKVVLIQRDADYYDVGSPELVCSSCDYIETFSSNLDKFRLVHTVPSDILKIIKLPDSYFESYIDHSIIIYIDMFKALKALNKKSLSADVSYYLSNLDDSFELCIDYNDNLYLRKSQSRIGSIVDSDTCDGMQNTLDEYNNGGTIELPIVVHSCIVQPSALIHSDTYLQNHISTVKELKRGIQ